MRLQLCSLLRFCLLLPVALCAFSCRFQSTEADLLNQKLSGFDSWNREVGRLLFDSSLCANTETLEIAQQLKPSADETLFLSKEAFGEIVVPVVKARMELVAAAAKATPNGPLQKSILSSILHKTPLTYHIYWFDTEPEFHGDIKIASTLGKYVYCRYLLWESHDQADLLVGDLQVSTTPGIGAVFSYKMQIPRLTLLKCAANQAHWSSIETNYNMHAIDSLSGLCRELLDSHRYTEAVEKAQQGEKISKALLAKVGKHDFSFHASLLIFCFDICEAYTNLKEYVLAKKKLAEIQVLIDSWTDYSLEEERAMIQNRLARIAALQGDFESAEKHYLQALKIIQEVGDVGIQEDSYLGLIRLYRESGQNKKLDAIKKQFEKSKQEF